MKNMKTNVAEAVARLQARRQHLKDYWHIEQAEAALDILLAQPDRQDEPRYLVRNALADAGKKLKRRARLAADYACFRQLEDEGSDDDARAFLHATDFIERTLTPADRTVLRLVLGGAEPNEIADTLGTSVLRSRERLSRARARARAAWEREAA
jgi:FixJ family two-component response regulator